MWTPSFVFFIAFFLLTPEVAPSLASYLFQKIWSRFSGPQHRDLYTSFQIGVQVDTRWPYAPNAPVLVSDYIQTNADSCCSVQGACVNSPSFVLPAVPGAKNYLNFTGCQEVFETCTVTWYYTLQSLITIQDQWQLQYQNSSIGNCTIIANRGPSYYINSDGWPECGFGWQRTIRTCGTLYCAWSDDTHTITVTNTTPFNSVPPRAPNVCDWPWGPQWDPQNY